MIFSQQCHVETDVCSNTVVDPLTHPLVYKKEQQFDDYMLQLLKKKKNKRGIKWRNSIKWVRLAVQWSHWRPPHTNWSETVLLASIHILKTSLWLPFAKLAMNWNALSKVPLYDLTGWMCLPPPISFIFSLYLHCTFEIFIDKLDCHR